MTAMRAVWAAAPDARLVMLLVPSSVQICDPADFDYNQPQRLASALATEIGAEVLDLDDPLRARSAVRASRATCTG
jgi:hypothetical protein